MITFPDVSNHNGGLVIQPGTVFVWAKASEGTYYTDPTYQDFKAQAASVGTKFGAYHFLTSGNGAAQADYAFATVDKDVPLFVDVEPTGSSYPTVHDVVAFTTRYRALGGIVQVQYYPKWYAASQGANLALTGLLTISSDYTGDPNTVSPAYNGVQPFQNQYTDAQSYGGQSVDFNSYPGTLDEFLAAIGVPAPPVPPVTPPPVLEEDLDMLKNSTIIRLSDSADIWCRNEDGKLWHVASEKAVFALEALGCDSVTFTEADITSLKAAV